MTRWARVGNSQKHHKLPEDATPWEDFWQNRNQNSAGEGNRNKVKSGRIEKKKQKKKLALGEKSKKFVNPKNEISKIKNAEQQGIESDQNSPTFSSKTNKDEEQLSTEFQGLSKKQLKKAKKKQKMQQLKNAESTDSKEFENPKNEVLKFKNAEQQECESDQNSPIFSSKSNKDEEQLSTEFQGLSKKQLRKAKKKEKLQQLKGAESVDMQDVDTANEDDSAEVSQNEEKPSSEKDSLRKKKFFMKQLEKKRLANGILLLPPKVERRLYLIKRRLREKGLPPEVIKNIARKERRKEELKFRRSVSTKPCFNCRQIGHLLAECPLKLGNSNQETGLCFKCGSDEHTSYKCPEKIKGYPLAKCFVCQEQGHISKDCPKNEHGIYIKGGKCSLCGNVNHLKKDCPTLKKKDDNEVDITAYTINQEKSVDAEIIPAEDDEKPNVITSMKKGKKAKLVKF